MMGFIPETRRFILLVLTKNMEKKMNIENKIDKIAEWIAYESDDKVGEISVLLHNLYNKKSLSGLSHNIDEAYGDVLNHLNERK